MIDRILIPIRYIFFYRSPHTKNSEVKRLAQKNLGMDDRPKNLSGCA
jgi:hypothetical protein